MKKDLNKFLRWLGRASTAFVFSLHLIISPFMPVAFAGDKDLSTGGDKLTCSVKEKVNIVTAYNNVYCEEPKSTLVNLICIELKKSGQPVNYETVTNYLRKLLEEKSDLREKVGLNAFKSVFKKSPNECDMRVLSEIIYEDLPKTCIELKVVLDSFRERFDDCDSSKAASRTTGKVDLSVPQLESTTKTLTTGPNEQLINSGFCTNLGVLAPTEINLDTYNQAKNKSLYFLENDIDIVSGHDAPDSDDTEIGKVSADSITTVFKFRGARDTFFLKKFKQDSTNLQKISDSQNSNPYINSLNLSSNTITSTGANVNVFSGNLSNSTNTDQAARWISTGNPVSIKLAAGSNVKINNDRAVIGISALPENENKLIAFLRGKDVNGNYVETLGFSEKNMGEFVLDLSSGKNFNITSSVNGQKLVHNFIEIPEKIRRSGVKEKFPNIGIGTLGFIHDRTENLQELGMLSSTTGVDGFNGITIFDFDSATNMINMAYHFYGAGNSSVLSQNYLLKSLPKLNPEGASGPFKGDEKIAGIKTIVDPANPDDHYVLVSYYRELMSQSVASIPETFHRNISTLNALRSTLSIETFHRNVSTDGAFFSNIKNDFSKNINLVKFSSVKQYDKHSLIAVGSDTCVPYSYECTSDLMGVRVCQPNGTWGLASSCSPVCLCDPANPNGCLNCSSGAPCNCGGIGIGNCKCNPDGRTWTCCTGDVKTNVCISSPISCPNVTCTPGEIKPPGNVCNNNCSSQINPDQYCRNLHGNKECIRCDGYASQGTFGDGCIADTAICEQRSGCTVTCDPNNSSSDSKGCVQSCTSGMLCTSLPDPEGHTKCQEWHPELAGFASGCYLCDYDGSQPQSSKHEDGCIKQENICQECCCANLGFNFSIKQNISQAEKDKLKKEFQSVLTQAYLGNKGSDYISRITKTKNYSSDLTALPVKIQKSGKAATQNIFIDKLSLASTVTGVNLSTSGGAEIVLSQSTVKTKTKKSKTNPFTGISKVKPTAGVVVKLVCGAACMVNVDCMNVCEVCNMGVCELNPLAECVFSGPGSNAQCEAIMTGVQWGVCDNTCMCVACGAGPPDTCQDRVMGCVNITYTTQPGNLPIPAPVGNDAMCVMCSTMGITAGECYYKNEKTPPKGNFCACNQDCVADLMGKSNNVYGGICAPSTSTNGCKCKCYRDRGGQEFGCPSTIAAATMCCARGNDKYSLCNSCCSNKDCGAGSCCNRTHINGRVFKSCGPCMVIVPGPGGAIGAVIGGGGVFPGAIGGPIGGPIGGAIGAVGAVGGPVSSSTTSSSSSSGGSSSSSSSSGGSSSSSSSSSSGGSSSSSSSSSSGSCACSCCPAIGCKCDESGKIRCDNCLPACPKGTSLKCQSDGNVHCCGIQSGVEVCIGAPICLQKDTKEVIEKFHNNSGAVSYTDVFKYNAKLAQLDFKNVKIFKDVFIDGAYFSSEKYIKKQDIKTVQSTCTINNCPRSQGCLSCQGVSGDTATDCMCNCGSFDRNATCSCNACLGEPLSCPVGMPFQTGTCKECNTCLCCSDKTQEDSCKCPGCSSYDKTLNMCVFTKPSCPSEIAPVKGCDGIYYQSECHALQSGIKNYTPESWENVDGTKKCTRCTEKECCKDGTDCARFCYCENGLPGTCPGSEICLSTCTLHPSKRSDSYKEIGLSCGNTNPANVSCKPPKELTCVGGATKCCDPDNPSDCESISCMPCAYCERNLSGVFNPKCCNGLPPVCPARNPLLVCSGERLDCCRDVSGARICDGQDKPVCCSDSNQFGFTGPYIHQTRKNLFWSIDHDVDGSANTTAQSGMINDIVVLETNTDNLSDVMSFVTTWFAKGDGRFSGSSTSEIPLDGGVDKPVPCRIAKGDFNNDNYIDLVVGSIDQEDQQSSILILHGASNGQFTKVKTIRLGEVSSDNKDPMLVETGDFNRDGKVDIAVTFFKEGVSVEDGILNTVAIITNNGGNNYTITQEITIEPLPGEDSQARAQSFDSIIKTYDIDGNGALDIVANGLDLNQDLPNAFIAVLYNNGSGTFDAPVKYSVGKGDTTFTVGDYNNDSKPDVLVNLLRATSSEFKNIILKNTGNKTFSTPSPVAGVDTQGVPYTFDINVDNKQDILFANIDKSALDVYLGAGNYTFTKSLSLATGVGPRVVHVGDYNKDTKLDIAISNFISSNFYVYLQNSRANSCPTSSSGGSSSGGSSSGGSSSGGSSSSGSSGTNSCASCVVENGMTTYMCCDGSGEPGCPANAPFRICSGTRVGCCMVDENNVIQCGNDAPCCPASACASSGSSSSSGTICPSCNESDEIICCNGIKGRCPYGYTKDCMGVINGVKKAVCVDPSGMTDSDVIICDGKSSSSSSGSPCAVCEATSSGSTFMAKCCNGNTPLCPDFVPIVLCSGTKVTCCSSSGAGLFCGIYPVSCDPPCDCMATCSSSCSTEALLMAATCCVNQNIIREFNLYTSGEESVIKDTVNSLEFSNNKVFIIKNNQTTSMELLEVYDVTDPGNIMTLISGEQGSIQSTPIEIVGSDLFVLRDDVLKVLNVANLNDITLRALEDVTGGKLLHVKDSRAAAIGNRQLYVFDASNVNSGLNLLGKISSDDQPSNSSIEPSDLFTNNGKVYILNNYKNDLSLSTVDLIGPDVKRISSTKIGGENIAIAVKDEMIYILEKTSSSLSFLKIYIIDSSMKAKLLAKIDLNAYAEELLVTDKYLFIGIKKSGQSFVNAYDISQEVPALLAVYPTKTNNVKDLDVGNGYLYAITSELAKLFIFDIDGCASGASKCTSSGGSSSSSSGTCFSTCISSSGVLCCNGANGFCPSGSMLDCSAYQGQVRASCFNDLTGQPVNLICDGSSGNIPCPICSDSGEAICCNGNIGMCSDGSVPRCSTMLGNYNIAECCESGVCKSENVRCETSSGGTCPPSCINGIPSCPCNGFTYRCPAGTNRTACIGNESKCCKGDDCNYDPECVMSTSSSSGGCIGATCDNSNNIVCCDGTAGACLDGYIKNCGTIVNGVKLTFCCSKTTSVCTDQNIICGISSSGGSSSSSGSCYPICISSSGLLCCNGASGSCPSGSMLVCTAYQGTDRATCSNNLTGQPVSPICGATSSSGTSICEPNCSNDPVCCSGTKITCPNEFNQFTCNADAQRTPKCCTVSNNRLTCDTKPPLCEASSGSCFSCIGFEQNPRCCNNATPTCPNNQYINCSNNKCCVINQDGTLACFGDVQCTSGGTSSGGSSSSSGTCFSTCITSSGILCCNGASGSCPSGSMLDCSAYQGKVRASCFNNLTGQPVSLICGGTSSGGSSSGGTSSGENCSYCDEDQNPICCNGAEPYCSPSYPNFTCTGSELECCKVDPITRQLICSGKPVCTSSGGTSSGDNCSYCDEDQNPLCCNGAEPYCSPSYPNFTCTGNELECCKVDQVTKQLICSGKPVCTSSGGSSSGGSSSGVCNPGCSNTSGIVCCDNSPGYCPSGYMLNCNTIVLGQRIAWCVDNIGMTTRPVCSSGGSSSGGSSSGGLTSGCAICGDDGSLIIPPGVNPTCPENGVLVCVSTPTEMVTGCIVGTEFIRCIRCPVCERGRVVGSSGYVPYCPAGGTLACATSFVHTDVGCIYSGSMNEIFLKDDAKCMPPGTSSGSSGTSCNPSCTGSQVCCSGTVINCPGDFPNFTCSGGTPKCCAINNSNLICTSTPPICVPSSSSSSSGIIQCPTCDDSNNIVCCNGTRGSCANGQSVACRLFNGIRVAQCCDGSQCTPTSIICGGSSSGGSSSGVCYPGCSNTSGIACCDNSPGYCPSGYTLNCNTIIQGQRIAWCVDNIGMTTRPICSSGGSSSGGSSSGGSSSGGSSSGECRTTCVSSSGAVCCNNAAAYCPSGYTLNCNTIIQGQRIAWCVNNVGNTTKPLCSSGGSSSGGSSSGGSSSGIVCNPSCSNATVCCNGTEIKCPNDFPSFTCSFGKPECCNVVNMALNCNDSVPRCVQTSSSSSGQCFSCVGTEQIPICCNNATPSCPNNQFINCSNGKCCDINPDGSLNCYGNVQCGVSSSSSGGGSSGLCPKCLSSSGILCCNGVIGKCKSGTVLLCSNATSSSGKIAECCSGNVCNSQNVDCSISTSSSGVVCPIDCDSESGCCEGHTAKCDDDLFNLFTCAFGPPQCCSLSGVSLNCSDTIKPVCVPTSSSKGLVIHLDSTEPISYSGGQKWNDITPFMNNATLGTNTNVESIDPIFECNAFKFNSLNRQLAIIPSASVLNPGLNDFSIQLWFRPQDTDFSVLLSKKPVNGTANPPGFSITLNHLSPVLELSDGSNAVQIYSENMVLQNLKWHQLTFLVDRDDSNATKIFVDGNKVLNGISGPNNEDLRDVKDITNNFQLTLGSLSPSVSANGGLFFNGSIGLLKIYDHLLSDSQVQSSYNLEVNKFMVCSSTSSSSSGSTSSGDFPICNKDKIICPNGNIGMCLPGTVLRCVDFMGVQAAECCVGENCSRLYIDCEVSSSSSSSGACIAAPRCSNSDVNKRNCGCPGFVPKCPSSDPDYRCTNNILECCRDIGGDQVCGLATPMCQMITTSSSGGINYDFCPTDSNLILSPQNCLSNISQNGSVYVPILESKDIGSGVAVIESHLAILAVNRNNAGFIDEENPLIFVEDIPTDYLDVECPPFAYSPEKIIKAPLSGPITVSACGSSVFVADKLYKKNIRSFGIDFGLLKNKVQKLKEENAGLIISSSNIQKNQLVGDDVDTFALNKLNIFNPNILPLQDPIMIKVSSDRTYSNSFISDIDIARNNILVVGVSERLSGDIRSEMPSNDIPLMGKIVTLQLTGEVAPTNCCNFKQSYTTDLEPATNPITIEGGMNSADVKGFRVQTRFGEIACEKQSFGNQLGAVVALHGADRLFGVGLTESSPGNLSLNSQVMSLILSQGILQGSIANNKYIGDVSDMIYFAPVSNYPSVNDIDRPLVKAVLLESAPNSDKLTLLNEEEIKNLQITANDLSPSNKSLSKTLLPNYYTDLDFSPDGLYFASAINNNNIDERKNPVVYTDFYNGKIIKNNIVSGLQSSNTPYTFEKYNEDFSHVKFDIQPNESSYYYAVAGNIPKNKPASNDPATSTLSVFVFNRSQAYTDSKPRTVAVLTQDGRNNTLDLGKIFLDDASKLVTVLDAEIYKGILFVSFVAKNPNESGFGQGYLRAFDLMRRTNDNDPYTNYVKPRGDEYKTSLIVNGSELKSVAGEVVIDPLSDTLYLLDKYGTNTIQSFAIDLLSERVKDKPVLFVKSGATVQLTLPTSMGYSNISSADLTDDGKYLFVLVTDCRSSSNFAKVLIYTTNTKLVDRNLLPITNADASVSLPSNNDVATTCLLNGSLPTSSSGGTSSGGSSGIVCSPNCNVENVCCSGTKITCPADTLFTCSLGTPKCCLFNGYSINCNSGISPECVPVGSSGNCFSCDGVSQAPMCCNGATPQCPEGQFITCSNKKCCGIDSVSMSLTCFGNVSCGTSSGGNLDQDTDKDGVIDRDEDINRDGDVDNDDTDRDGTPNYMDTDDDGDGILTKDEDINRDGKPNNDDTDKDSIPDYLEPNDLDIDSDGKTNNKDNDDDGDGIPTKDEDNNNNKTPLDDDRDNDTVPDYLEPDNVDLDNDGASNMDDPDDDGDNVLTRKENPVRQDTDKDGKPDYLDTDDDADGVKTIDEDPDGNGNPANDDTDNNSVPNYLDSDDDDDTVPTKNEDVDKSGTSLDDDTDRDGIPNYLDDDDDGDGLPTHIEDTKSDGDSSNDDRDGDSVADYLEPDDVDLDSDGLTNVNDPDDDGDGILTIDEDANGNGTVFDDDSDRDGINDFLDPNSGSVCVNCTNNVPLCCNKKAPKCAPGYTYNCTSKKCCKQDVTSMTTLCDKYPTCNPGTSSSGGVCVAVCSNGTPVCSSGNCDFICEDGNPVCSDNVPKCSTANGLVDGMCVPDPLDPDNAPPAIARLPKVINPRILNAPYLSEAVINSDALTLDEYQNYFDQELNGNRVNEMFVTGGKAYLVLKPMENNSETTLDEFENSEYSVISRINNKITQIQPKVIDIVEKTKETILEIDVDEDLPPGDSSLLVKNPEGTKYTCRANINVIPALKVKTFVTKRNLSKPRITKMSIKELKSRRKDSVKRFFLTFRGDGFSGSRMIINGKRYKSPIKLQPFSFITFTNNAGIKLLKIRTRRNNTRLRVTFEYDDSKIKTKEDVRYFTISTLTGQAIGQVDLKNDMNTVSSGGMGLGYPLNTTSSSGAIGMSGSSSGSSMTGSSSGSGAIASSSSSGSSNVVYPPDFFLGTTTGGPSQGPPPNGNSSWGDNSSIGSGGGGTGSSTGYGSDDSSGSSYGESNIGSGNGFSNQVDPSQEPVNNSFNGGDSEFDPNSLNQLVFPRPIIPDNINEPKLPTIELKPEVRSKTLSPEIVDLSKLDLSGVDQVIISPQIPEAKHNIDLKKLSFKESVVIKNALDKDFIDCGRCSGDKIFNTSGNTPTCVNEKDYMRSCSSVVGEFASCCKKSNISQCDPTQRACIIKSKDSGGSKPCSCENGKLVCNSTLPLCSVGIAVCKDSSTKNVICCSELGCSDTTKINYIGVKNIDRGFERLTLPSGPKEVEVSRGNIIGSESGLVIYVKGSIKLLEKDTASISFVLLDKNKKTTLLNSSIKLLGPNKLFAGISFPGDLQPDSYTLITLLNQSGKKIVISKGKIKLIEPVKIKNLNVRNSSRVILKVPNISNIKGKVVGKDSNGNYLVKLEIQGSGFASRLVESEDRLFISKANISNTVISLQDASDVSIKKVRALPSGTRLTVVLRTKNLDLTKTPIVISTPFGQAYRENIGLKFGVKR